MKEYIVRYETEQIENSEFFYGGKVECELVRCKDCKYLPGAPRLYADDDPVESYIHCCHLGEDGYCSFAKRRE